MLELATLWYLKLVVIYNLYLRVFSNSKPAFISFPFLLEVKIETWHRLFSFKEFFSATNLSSFCNFATRLKLHKRSKLLTSEILSNAAESSWRPSKCLDLALLKGIFYNIAILMKVCIRPLESNNMNTVNSELWNWHANSKYLQKLVAYTNHSSSGWIKSEGTGGFLLL